MASKVTYVNALTTIRDFAVENGFNNDEVIKKINALINQKSKTRTSNGKSKALETNEKIITKIVNAMRENGNTELTNKNVCDIVNNSNELSELAGKTVTAPRATAILNAGVNLGIIERHVHQKSATRNTLTYEVK